MERRPRNICCLPCGMFCTLFWFSARVSDSNLSTLILVPKELKSQLWKKLNQTMYFCLFFPKKINSVVLLCFHFCDGTSFFLGVNFAPSYIDNCTFTQNANPRLKPCGVPFIPFSLKLLHWHVSIHLSLSSTPRVIKE